METLTFTIDGPAVAKQRPRLGGRYRSGGSWRRAVFTPQKTRDYEGKVANAFFVKYGNKKLTGQLAVELVFYLKSRGRADIDNLIKSVLDGLKEVFNDRQVVAIKAFLLVGGGERTEVNILLYT